MDLLDRYLMSVGFLLPLSERTEILAELRDILLSKFEEEEEAKGSPLTELERESVLYDFGHPLVVAGRYRKDSFAVGPQLYPFWLLVMQIGAATSVISGVAVGVLNGLKHHNLLDAVLWMIGRSIGQFVILTGIVTLVFIYLERSGHGQRLIGRWRPSQLPAIKIKPASRFERGFEVAGGLVALLFWTGLAAVPVDYPIHPGATVHLAAAPLVTALYWPVAGLIVARMAGNAIALFQLGVASQRNLLQMLVSLGTMGLIAFTLWAAGSFDRAALTTAPFVQVTGLPEPALDQVIFGVNLGIVVALACGAVGAGIEAAVSAFKLLRGSRPTS